MKNSFVLYHENSEVFNALADDQAGRLIKAIFEYELSGRAPPVDTLLGIIFIPIKQALDRNSEKYEATRERNKANARMRWHKDDTKNADNDNVLVNDPDNDPVNANDPDNVNDPVNENPKPRGGGRRKKPIGKTKYAEFVSMTNDEYSSLVAKHGDQAVKRFIETLDNYKGASGKSYKSDYRAILAWVVKRDEDDLAQSRKSVASNVKSPTGNPFFDMVVNGEVTDGD